MNKREQQSDDERQQDSGGQRPDFPDQPGPQPMTSRPSMTPAPPEGNPPEPAQQLEEDAKSDDEGDDSPDSR